MSTSDIADLIVALRTGALSLDDVAKQFRERRWPHTRRPVPQNYLELAAQAQLDPATDIPGSFDEVLGAYDRGEITRDQYRTLVEAAAESIRAEAEGSGGNGAG